MAQTLASRDETSRHSLSSYDYIRMAAEAVVSPQTVRRIYAGARSAATTRERVRRAAAALGLPPPPEATDLDPHAAA